MDGQKKVFSVEESRAWPRKFVQNCEVAVMSPQCAAKLYDAHEGAKCTNTYNHKLYGVLLFDDPEEGERYSFQNETPNLAEFKSLRIINVIPNVSNAEFQGLCAEVVQ